jgi:hypothetical protein
MHEIRFGGVKNVTHVVMEKAAVCFSAVADRQQQ